MKQILEFLVADGAFLYEEFDCRIVDSKYCPAFGGTGHITLRSNKIDLKLWLDEEKLFLNLREKGLKSHLRWHSIDIIRRMLTKEITDNALADRGNVDFLREHFERIQDAFSRAKLVATRSACKSLERDRAKRHFG